MRAHEVWNISATASVPFSVAFTDRLLAGVSVNGILTAAVAAPPPAGSSTPAQAAQVHSIGMQTHEVRFGAGLMSRHATRPVRSANRAVAPLDPSQNVTRMPITRLRPGALLPLPCTR